MVFLNIHVRKSFDQNLWKISVKEFILSWGADPTDENLLKMNSFTGTFQRLTKDFRTPI